MAEEETNKDEILEFHPSIFEEEFTRIIANGQTRRHSEKVLSVTAPDGLLLWDIFSDVNGNLDRIVMTEGSIIKRAEGTEFYIFAMRGIDDNLYFYILETLVVDPKTGNLFMDANGGAYTGAYLNSGWQAQHFVKNNKKKWYVVQPRSKGIRKVDEVSRIEIDVELSEVKYEELGGSSWKYLPSRLLKKGSSEGET